MVPRLLLTAAVTKHYSLRRFFVCLGALVLLAPSSTFAQSGPDDPEKPVGSSPPSGSTQAPADDEATIQPAEPDYRLVNLPTTLRLPLHRGNFELTHRFAGNLEEGDFGDQLANLFGLDQGAIVGLEFRFAVVRHVQAAVYRTSFEKNIQFYGKYDALHQTDSSPLSISALVSIEGTNNFQEHYAPALGAVVSRTFADRVAVYGTPIWVHNTAADTGVTRDTFLVGVGGRLRFFSSAYLVAEVSPRVGGYDPGQTEYAFGIEKRVGGHLFQLNFTNTWATTFGQLARGGSPSTLYLGFNLARKFY